MSKQKIDFTYVREVWGYQPLLALAYVPNAFLNGVYGLILGLLQWMDRITDKTPVIPWVWNNGYKPLLYIGKNYSKTVLFTAVALLMVAVVQIAKIDASRVNPDSETMLHYSQPDMAIHNQAKRDFLLWNQLFIAFICESCEKGALNPEVLNFGREMVKYLGTLGLKGEGVYAPDIGSPSTFETIYHKDGIRKREAIHKGVLTTQQEADLVRHNLMKNPLLYGTIIDKTGSKFGMGVPVQNKARAYEIM